MTRTLRNAVNAALAAVVVFVSAGPWIHAYQGVAIVVALAGAALLSVAIPVVLVRGRETPFAGTVTASGVVFVAFTLLVVLREPAGVGTLVDGLTHGTARLLAVTLPVNGGHRWLLVPPTLATWMAGAIAGELVTRSRATSWPLPLAAMSFLAAVSVTAGAPGNNVAWAVACLMTSIALTAMLRVDAERVAADAAVSVSSSSRRAVLAGAAVLVAVALVAGAVVPRLGRLSGPPAAPERRPATQTPEYDTPIATMSTLREQAQHDDAPLFTVDFDRPASPYVAIAQLDHYDGETWSFDHHFRTTGGRIPDPALISVSRAAVAPTLTARFRLDRTDLVAPWMPYVTRPVGVSDADVRYDATSGMLLPPAAGGARRYTLRAHPSPPLEDVRSELVGYAPQEDYEYPLERGTDLDNWADDLAQRTGVPKGGTKAFLIAMARAFRSSFSRAVPDANTSTLDQTRGGTSFADVAAALGQHHTATPEQFATLYALVARRLGVPARVVTGFRLDSPDQTASPTRGQRVVHASQAWTWVEVPLGSQWVIIDPTPATTRAPDKDAASAGSTTTTTLAQAASTPAQHSENGRALAPRSKPVKHASHHAGSIGTIALVVGMVFLLAAAVVLSSPLRRARRRRRRNRGAAVVRAAGGWQETLDTLREAGVRQIAPWSASEIALHATERFGPDAGALVAAQATDANAALYWTAGPNDERAASMWTRVAPIRKEVRRSLGFVDRIRMLVSVARRDRPTTAR